MQEYYQQPTVFHDTGWWPARPQNSPLWLALLALILAAVGGGMIIYLWWTVEIVHWLAAVGGAVIMALASTGLSLLSRPWFKRETLFSFPQLPDYAAIRFQSVEYGRAGRDDIEPEVVELRVWDGGWQTITRWQYGRRMSDVYYAAYYWLKGE